MKKILITLSLMFVFIYTLYHFIEVIRFNSLIEKIDVPPIPSGEIVPRDIHDMILNPYDRIVHKIEGKECVRNGDGCPQEKYECLEWEKGYYDGKLSSYTLYELFPIPQSEYYQQRVKYNISFYENGKISWIEHPKGFQKFDTNENLVKVCEKGSNFNLKKGCMYRKCWKNEEGKWIPNDECWIE